LIHRQREQDIPNIWKIYQLKKILFRILVALWLLAKEHDFYKNEYVYIWRLTADMIFIETYELIGGNS